MDVRRCHRNGQTLVLTAESRVSIRMLGKEQRRTILMKGLSPRPDVGVSVHFDWCMYKTYMSRRESGTRSAPSLLC